MAWAPDYTTVGDLSSYLRIDDLIDAAELGLAITAASRAIDNACNRQFGKVAAAAERLYTARPDYERGWWVADVDDFMTTDGLAVAVADTAVPTTTLEPINAAGKARPWTRVVFTADSEAQPSGDSHEVAVTALWGWTDVPATVVQATLLQASRFFKRRDAPFGVAGSPEVGSELRLLAKVDPDVAVMLGDYRRLRAVG